uniref:Uncharacterized protein n=1 Tax=Globodera rostochiensis TaxID=31243 RepID=A0A914IBV3_GLORO
MSNVLETISGDTVQFHSAEWYLDADFQFVHRDLNNSFKNGCLCLFILLVCPFTSGFYGESGISIFVAAVSLAITMAFVVVKLRTESLTYGLLAIGLILCALATILLNVHRRVLQTELEAVLQTNSVPSTDPLLIFFVAMALFLASAAYVVDIWVVYRQRRWRTWIVDRSKYQI